MQVDPPGIEHEGLGHRIDVGGPLGLLAGEAQQALLPQPGVREELRWIRVWPWSATTNTRDAGGQRREQLAEHIVEPAIEVEEALVMRRRGVDVLAPEVVVQTIALGDDADEEVPGLVAQQRAVRAGAGRRAWR